MSRQRAHLSWALSIWLFAGTPVGTSPAFAQANPTVQTEVGSREVRVGQPFRVQISVALGDDGLEPQKPELPVQGPAQVRGPSVGTSRSVTMRNFSVSSETRVTATFTILPTAKGRLELGPGSFLIGGKRIIGERFEVLVTDTGPPSRSRSRFGRDPFDDFFSQGPFDVFRNRAFDSPGLPELPEALRPAIAESPVGFLSARLSTTQAVVGEPIVLTIYAFGAEGPFQELSSVEPSTAQFLVFREVQSSYDQPRYVTEIDGRQYQVAKLREFVLVPLTEGPLEIGAMRVALSGQGYPRKGNALGFEVASKPLTLDVERAPTKGRPPSFVEGDVGQFELRATLTPTELTVGEYAELMVEIHGKGNLPTRIPLPESTAWEWQASTTSGEPEPKNGALVGTRVLKVPLRALEVGRFQLGPLKLSYFDPELDQYRVATATLPPLTIQAAAAPLAAPDSEPRAMPERWSAALEFDPNREPLRRALGPLSKAEQIPLLAWILVFGLPACGGLLWGLVGLVASARRRALEKPRLPFPRNRADDAFKQLMTGLGQNTTIASDLPRKALVSVVHAHLGLNLNGLLLDDLPRELARLGFEASLAEKLKHWMGRVDQAGFAGDTLTRTELEELGRFLKSLKSSNTKRRRT